MMHQRQRFFSKVLILLSALVVVDGFGTVPRPRHASRKMIHVSSRSTRPDMRMNPIQRLPASRTAIFSVKDDGILKRLGSSTAVSNSTTALPVMSLGTPEIVTSASSDTADDASSLTTANGVRAQHNTNGLVDAGPSCKDSAVSSAKIEKRPSFPVILWRFTRPHTLIGSALAIPALHLLAAPTWASVWTTRHAASILYALVPSLLMNLYVTGLNQITDVEIDKINKPNLPIAAGLLSKRDAIVTVVIALVVSLGLGHAHPIYGTAGLQTVLYGSALLGTLYSLPPFRLKRFPLLAAFCIVAVRGAIINASFFCHAQAAAFGAVSATATSSSVWACLQTNARCLWSSIFFGGFGIVIALMKDVPDVLGDQTANVRTLSVRVGPQRIFVASRRLLAAWFGASAVVFGMGAVQAAAAAVAAATASGASMTSLLRTAATRLIVAASAGRAAKSVQQQARRVDPTNPKQVYQYYMHLWKLFYLCYLVLPLAR